MPVKDSDILKLLLLKEEETETLRMTFEDDPMGFILKKYPGLNEVMEYMMTPDFRVYLTAIFIVAPKPTTFKVILHNGQYFFLQFMGKAYQATVLGKNYYLMSIGEKERCMLAIARLLRYGIPINTKGPESGEEGTRPEGEAGGGETGGGEAGGEEATAAETPAAGEEEAPVTESMILENILKKSLFEARGIMYRKTNDEFTDGNTVLLFKDAKVYPQGSTAYKSKEDMDAEIKALETQFGKKIEFVNSPSKSLLAFGLVTLTDQSTNDDVYWGRYFKSTSSVSWDNSDTPGGKFKPNFSSAKKYTVKVSPQDLIKTSDYISNISEVVKKVYQNADPQMRSSLWSALNEIGNGKLPVFKDQAENLNALRDNFGEIMAPLALRVGLVDGSQEIEKELLPKGDTWAGCKISWTMSKTERLVDSKMMSPSAFEVAISSKGQKGADSSAANIWTAIEKSDKALKTKYQDYVDIIEIIEKEGQEKQIFSLAAKTNLNNYTSLQSEIEGYIKNGKSNFSGITTTAKELIDAGKIAGFTVKEDTPGFNTGRALLAILAKLVVEEINKSETIKFSEATKAFMNNSTMVQIYCYMSKKGNDAEVTGFKAIYPPKFSGKASLSAQKNYTSAQTKGKLTFGYK